MSSSASFAPPWFDSVHRPNFPSLDADRETDICVIGGGIAGVTTAYLLSRQGRDVLLLEADRIGNGETGRTTAHLSCVLDDRFTRMRRTHGEERTKKSAQSHAFAIDRIESIVNREDIDCSFERVNGYLFNPPENDMIDLDEELKAAHDAGVSAEMIGRAPFPSFDTGRAISFSRQAQFHPIKYLFALANAAVREGASVHERTRVTNAKEEEGACTVETEHGNVRCNHIVVATNAPVIDNAILYANQAPYRTFAIAAEIQPDDLERALYWDTEEPYHYIRVQRMQEGLHLKKVLIVGGEDVKTGHADDGEERLQRLESWARERVPEMGNVLFRWSGQVMEPSDGMAIIGKKPGNERIYVITGDSGMGLTHGTLGAHIISDAILGRPNPWADAYDPMRFRLGATGEFLKENADVAKEIARDYVSPGEVSSADELKNGEGALLRKGPKKIALYRDDHGNITAHSAVCPHKGCIVHWNSLEKSWDCPCHGSRFDQKGAVLSGPTLYPLKPEEL